MTNEFARSLAKVLVHEGGYVNHPRDPGGATNQGVTQRVYDEFRRAAGKPVRSVKQLENAERDRLYRTRYWDMIKGDQLPSGISYVVFDGAVNSGSSQSVKWLQRALGVIADGMIGTQTLLAVNEHPNHDALVARILVYREKFLRALKTFKDFGKGWISRVNGVLKVGQAWAMGDVGPEVQFVPNGNQKAMIADAKKAPSPAIGDASAGVGGTSVVLSQATDQLTPYTNIDFVAKAVAVLTIVGAVVAIGGFIYRGWAANRTKQLNDALGIVPA